MSLAVLALHSEHLPGSFNLKCLFSLRVISSLSHGGNPVWVLSKTAAQVCEVARGTNSCYEAKEWLSVAEDSCEVRQWGMLSCADEKANKIYKKKGKKLREGKRDFKMRPVKNNAQKKNSSFIKHRFTANVILMNTSSTESGLPMQIFILTVECNKYYLYGKRLLSTPF